MKTSSLKFKFQTSQKTNFGSAIIVNKIIARLQDEKYDISKVTDKSISFERSPFRLVWNFQAPYILDGGNFEISKSEHETIVVLHYFINIFYYFLIWIALAIFLINQGEYSAILFFGAFILIGAFFQYNVSKNVSKDLLNDILSVD